MATPEQIAEGLTEAQRAALTQPMRYAYGNTIMQWCPRSTLRALEKRDLAFGACLTPLGLAVRRILEGTNP